MFSFLLNPFFILPMMLVGWAQIRVRSAVKKSSQELSTARLTGAETARRRDASLVEQGDGERPKSAWERAAER